CRPDRAICRPGTGPRPERASDLGCRVRGELPPGLLGMSGPKAAPEVAMVERAEDPRFALQVRIVTTTALRMAGGDCDVAVSMLLSAALDVVVDSYDGEMPPDAGAMLHKAIDG